MTKTIELHPRTKLSYLSSVKISFYQTDICKSMTPSGSRVCPERMTILYVDENYLYYL